MPDSRAEVHNAADPEQVHRAERRADRRQRRFMEAMRAVLSTPAGRLVFGERELGLVARVGVYRSIWHPSAQIHYNAGRQDFGHELLAMLIDADEGLYLQMEHEMRALARRDASETEAAHTKPAAREGAQR